MPEPRRGEPLALICMRERDGRVTNEERLLSFGEWHDLVVTLYGEGGR